MLLLLDTSNGRARSPAQCPVPTAHCPLPTLAPWSCSCSPAHFTTGSSSHRPSPSAAAHIKHKSHCLAQTHSRCPSAILQSDSATVALRRVSPSILHILHSFVQHCTEHFIRSCKWYSVLVSQSGSRHGFTPHAVQPGSEAETDWREKKYSQHHNKPHIQ